MLMTLNNNKNGGISNESTQRTLLFGSTQIRIQVRCMKSSTYALSLIIRDVFESDGNQNLTFRMLGQWTTKFSNFITLPLFAFISNS